MEMLFWLQKYLEDLLMEELEMEEGHGTKGYESEHWKEEGHEVSDEQRSGCGMCGFKKPSL